MMYRTHVPAPPLSAFVSLFWYVEKYSSRSTKERILPTGTIELVISLNTEVFRIYEQQPTERFQTFSNSFISGPHSQFVISDSPNTSSLMGVHFKPGGAFPFLGVPASELKNIVLSLETLWGPKATHLRELLLAATATQTKFEILEQFLTAQIVTQSIPHPAVTFALSKFQSLHDPGSMSDVSQQIGLSHRRFIQIFEEQVGLTPKLFSRLQRFQNVLKLMTESRSWQWSEIALATGYYDQAHFVHDFRAFAGMSPTSCLDSAPHNNHVPIFD
jgi:AraC-like DNA-binding protein